MRREPVVFLDYHGVLTDGSPSSLVRPPAARFVPERARAALRALAGYALYVVSNQVGVALGDFSEADLVDGIRRFRADLSGDGVEIGDFLYCPHHPTAPRPAYRIKCICRKPSPYLVRQTLEARGTSPSRAALVGDTAETDIACAVAAGVLPILVGAGGGVPRPPTEVWSVPDLPAAASLVRRELPREPALDRR